MNANFFKTVLEYAIFIAGVLLVFLLVFERFLEMPLLVTWIGHWHPLVLHFPIVLIFVSIIQFWRKDTHLHWYLSVTSLFTLVSAITGLILSTENASKGAQLLVHQWLGVSVVLLMIMWLQLSKKSHSRLSLIWGIQGALAILIVITGHVGGGITHGENFLSLKTNQPAESMVSNPKIYENFVQPVLNDKCVKCHNDDKSKGKLKLNDYVSLASGGETGAGLDFSDTKNSLLFHRIALPLEDEDHMPPSDEKQLTAEQFMIVQEWLSAGASDTITMNGLAKESKLYSLIYSTLTMNESERYSSLPKISDSKLNSLSSDYITIERMYHGTDAVQVTAFAHADYNVSQLRGLSNIDNNIVSLDLTGLPIGAGEISLIRGCKNLERLNVGNSLVDDKTMEALGQIENLKELILYNTDVSDAAVPYIKDFTGLRKLFIYDTHITGEGISALRRGNNNLEVYGESEQAKSFISILPPATMAPKKVFFREQMKIKLTHPLKGINVHYTIDSSSPSESSAVLSDSLLVKDATLIKFFASKEGWEPSRVDSITMLKCGRKPDEIAIINAPDIKYPGRGIAQLTDLAKGPDDYEDSTWMAFRERNFLLQCEWNESINLSEIIFSSMVKTDSYLFPPESITIRAGEQKNAMVVVYEKKLAGLRDRKDSPTEHISCAFSPKTIKYMEIIVKPLSKIPLWHQGVGEKGWFFIDEVVFVENHKKPER